MSLASPDLIAGILALEEKANQAKSFAVGGLAIAILLGLMLALVIFGGGRDHS
jgi:hypothetical protein